MVWVDGNWFLRGVVSCTFVIPLLAFFPSSLSFFFFPLVFSFFTSSISRLCFLAHYFFEPFFFNLIFFVHILCFPFSLSML